LGVISYSIYLYHQITIHTVQKLTRSWPVISPVASILAVIAVASASYWLVERPVQRMKTRFLPGKPQTNERAVQERDSPVLLSDAPVVAAALSTSALVARSPEEAKG